MGKISKRIVFVLSSTIVLASCSGPPKGPLIPDGPGQIKLSDDSGYFSADGTNNYGVYGNFSISEELQDALSDNPLALNEAKKSHPFLATTFGGILLMTGLAARDLADTLDKKERLDDGELVDDSFQFSDIVPTLAAAIIVIFSSNRAESYVEQGVEMYNNQKKSETAESTSPDSRQPDLPRYTQQVELLPIVSGNWHSGWESSEETGGMMARWSLKF